MGGFGGIPECAGASIPGSLPAAVVPGRVLRPRVRCACSCSALGISPGGPGAQAKAPFQRRLAELLFEMHLSSPDGRSHSPRVNLTLHCPPLPPSSCPAKPATVTQPGGCCHSCRRSHSGAPQPQSR